jgi:yeast amino acid transporter
MIAVFPILYFGWKFLKKTKFLKPEEVDLHHPDLEEIEEYQRNYVPTPDKTLVGEWFNKLFS